MNISHKTPCVYVYVYVYANVCVYEYVYVYIFSSPENYFQGMTLLQTRWPQVSIQMLFISQLMHIRLREARLCFEPDALLNTDS